VLRGRVCGGAKPAPRKFLRFLVLEWHSLVHLLCKMCVLAGPKSHKMGKFARQSSLGVQTPAPPLARPMCVAYI